jgi:transcriptional regulator with XRE-family HTH domain
MLEHEVGASQGVAAPPQRPQPRPMPTAEQIRAARALLRWSAARLASEAGIAASTVARCEAGSGIPPVGVPTLQKIQRALEVAGVEFISGGNGPGVRLRRRP